VVNKGEYKIYTTVEHTFHWRQSLTAHLILTRRLARIMNNLL